MEEKEELDGKQPYNSQKGDLPDLRQEQYEGDKDFACRLLASMFQEVYAHTGREMPVEMFDRCNDFVDKMMDAVREEKRNGYL